MACILPCLTSLKYALCLLSQNITQTQNTGNTKKKSNDAKRNIHLPNLYVPKFATDIIQPLNVQILSCASNVL